MNIRPFLFLIFIPATVPARSETVSSGAPAMTIDLATTAGVAQVKGQWRYSNVKIVETEFRAAGADGQPGATLVKTYDISPRAGGADFDDSKWEVIDPATLSNRRGNGRISFAWYRISITVPDNLAGYDVVFSTSLDDYAEIWVDGELSRHFGQSGGSVVAGWNAENRFIIGRNVKPGQKIQLAIFGANGPLSTPPTNYIYLRYAKLEFYPGTKGPVAVTPSEVNVTWAIGRTRARLLRVTKSPPTARCQRARCFST